MQRIYQRCQLVTLRCASNPLQFKVLYYFLKLRSHFGELVQNFELRVGEALLSIIYIFECQKKPPHLPRGPRNSHINLKKIRIWIVGFYEDLTVCNSLKNPCPLRLTSRLQQRVHVRYNKQEYRNSLYPLQSLQIDEFCSGHKPTQLCSGPTGCG